MTTPHDPYAPDQAAAPIRLPSAEARATEVVVPNGSVKDVERWIGESKERARMALLAESQREGGPRRGVVRYAESVTDPGK